MSAATSPFSAPRGHAVIAERLFEATRAGRLPHALLFEGAAGIGKFCAARWFATGLLCATGPGPPCGRCGPCKRVVSGNHPDLFVIDPVADGEEQVRVSRIAHRTEAEGDAHPEGCLEGFLDLCAVESGLRPVLVREAHRMNAAAQNALLKTLEEPRPGTVLVLETHRLDRLLATILSRCVRVRFAPLAPADGRAVLEGHGIEGARAERLARFAGGSPGAALAFAQRGGEEVVAILAAVLAGECDPLAAAARLSELEGDFPGNTPSARARERARTILDVLVAVGRDAHRAAAGVDPTALAFGELAHAALQSVRAAEGDPLAAWARRLAALLAARADVERNVGPDGLLERALLDLAAPAPILGARTGPARS